MSPAKFHLSPTPIEIFAIYYLLLETIGFLAFGSLTTGMIFLN